MATGATARPFLHDLNIRVVLNRNGDAQITETRLMDIDSEGTECYIGLGNMGQSIVGNLRVKDETGREYTCVDDWDIDQSRQWKAGKCGIIEKRNGYELCWGLGDEGHRTYTTSYTITSLVHAYPDADAIRHVFLDEAVRPKPAHARLTIIPADGIHISPDSCGIWGFRFQGDLWFEGDSIVAESTEAFEDRSALYIMVKFPKGMFEPTIQEDDFEAHRADQDTEATYRVLMGELDMYAPGANEDEEKVLENDMDKLAEFSKQNDNVDFAGRIVWADVNGVRTEVFNFGKHKGLPHSQPVAALQ